MTGQNGNKTVGHESYEAYEELNVRVCLLIGQKKMIKKIHSNWGLRKQNNWKLMNGIFGTFNEFNSNMCLHLTLVSLLILDISYCAVLI
jgi:hypothetical protein